jgi:hypothetical protein
MGNTTTSCTSRIGSETELGAFNSKDAALYSTTFGGHVVIVDGIAPCRWSAPNAQGRGFAPAEKWDIFCMLPPNELVSGPAFGESLLVLGRRASPPGMSYTEPL